MKKTYFYLYTLVVFGYLFWRINWTLNDQVWVFSIIFLVCEFHDIWNTHTIFKNHALNAPELPVGESLSTFKPTLDIFITTYNENPELVEVTINAALEVDYKAEVWLLDDGKRDVLKDLCKKKGIHYITRENNTHAKAGNLNNALKYSKGEFILTLDADIIPFSAIANKVIHYFQDPKLAIVQMPQEFYNPNSFSHNPVNSKSLSHWNDQTLFFYFIQPGKDVNNSSFWCGSPSVLRRSAIEGIGGIRTETITEDIQTTIRLHSQGWKTKFHKEVLALGLAPDTLEGFLIQRYRWACGTFQLIHTKENPLTIVGLTIHQRLEYLWTILFYLSPITKVFIYFSAFLSFIIGELPMKSSVYNILIPFLLFTFLNTLLVKLNLKDAVKIWRIEILRFCLLPVYFKALHSLLFKKNMPFIVTPKDPEEFEKERTLLLLRPHIYIVLFSFSFLFLSLLELLGVTHLSGLNKEDLFISFIWMIPGTIIPLVTLYSISNRAPTEREHRFKKVINVTTQNNESRIQTEDLSYMGMCLRYENEQFEVDSFYQFTLITELGNLRLNGKCVWKNKNQKTTGINLIWNESIDKAAYLNYCYGFLTKEQLSTLEFPRVV